MSSVIAPPELRRADADSSVTLDLAETHKMIPNSRPVIPVLRLVAVVTMLQSAGSRRTCRGRRRPDLGVLSICAAAQLSSRRRR